MDRLFKGELQLMVSTMIIYRIMVMLKGTVLLLSGSWGAPEIIAVNKVKV